VWTTRGPQGENSEDTLNYRPHFGGSGARCPRWGFRGQSPRWGSGGEATAPPPPPDFAGDRFRWREECEGRPKGEPDPGPTPAGRPPRRRELCRDRAARICAKAQIVTRGTEAKIVTERRASAGRRARVAFFVTTKTAGDAGRSRLRQAHQRRSIIVRARERWGVGAPASMKLRSDRARPGPSPHRSPNPARRRRAHLGIRSIKRLALLTIEQSASARPWPRL
jgi:hypothetical protein